MKQIYQIHVRVVLVEVKHSKVEDHKLIHTHTDVSTEGTNY